MSPEQRSEPIRTAPPPCRSQWNRRRERSSVWCMRKVSSLKTGTAGDYRWVFILVAFSDYKSDVREEVRRQADAFAADLREMGMWVEAFEQAQWEVAREVLEKQWPNEIREKMEAASEPALLVIENDFDRFNPCKHRWAIVWLTDLRGDDDVRPFLKKIASTARRGDDVIGALNEAATRIAQKEQGARVARFTARAGSYIEWKPKLPLVGLQIDLKAILRDLARA
jgi:hypothetical protein